MSRVADLVFTHDQLANFQRLTALTIANHVVKFLNLEKFRGYIGFFKQIWNQIKYSSYSYPKFLLAFYWK